MIIQKSGLAGAIALAVMLFASPLLYAKYNDQPSFSAAAGGDSGGPPVSGLANIASTCDDTKFGEVLAGNEISQNESAAKYLEGAREQICPMLLREKGRKTFKEAIDQLNAETTKISDEAKRSQHIQFVRSLATMGRDLELGCNQYAEIAEYLGTGRKHLLAELKSAHARASSGVASGAGLGSGAGGDEMILAARNVADLTDRMNQQAIVTIRRFHERGLTEFMRTNDTVRTNILPRLKRLQAEFQALLDPFKSGADPIMREFSGIVKSFKPFTENALAVLNNDEAHIGNKSTCIRVASGLLSEADALLAPLSDYHDIPVGTTNPENDFGSIIPRDERGGENDPFFRDGETPDGDEFGSLDTGTQEIFASVRAGGLTNDGMMRLDDADDGDELKTAGMFDDLIQKAKDGMGFGANENLIDRPRVSRDFIRKAMTGDLDGVGLCSDRNNISDSTCVPNNPRLVPDWMREHRPDEYRRLYLDKTKPNTVSADPLLGDPFNSGAPTVDNQVAFCILGFGTTCEEEISDLGIMEESTRFKDYTRACMFNSACRNSGMDSRDAFRELRIRIMQGNGGVEPTEQDYMQAIQNGTRVRT